MLLVSVLAGGLELVTCNVPYCHYAVSPVGQRSRSLGITKRICKMRHIQVGKKPECF